MSGWLTVRQFDPSTLEANLDALKKRHPILWECVQPWLDASNLGLRRSESGWVECAAIVNGEAQLLVDSQGLENGIPLLNARIKSLTNASQAGLLFFMGWELGYAFVELFEKHLRNALWKLALVIEPDSRVFAASLAVHDLCEVFSLDRIFFAIGERWADQLTQIADRENLFALSNVEAFSGHPTPAKTEQRIRLQARRAAEAAMQKSRQSFEKELSEAIGFYSQKKPDKIRKILALEMSGGMAVSYIHNRFLEECRVQGIHVIYHKSAVLGGIGLTRAVAREKPDCVVMVNLAPEKYAPLALLDRMRVPRMVWFLDDPHNFIDAKVRFGQHDFLFTWDISYQSFFESHGARSVDHFPYVADLDRAKAKIRDEFLAPVSYIGQVSRFLPEEHGLDEITGAMCRKAGERKALEPQRSYRSLVEEYQAEFGLRIIQSEADPIPRNVSYAIYMVGNALLRIRVLERVMPYGLRLYGNADWLPVLGGHPLRECYQGPADPVRDVPDIFVSSTINVNIHSLHALASLNQRDFNCPLVGGFLLTDWVPGAEQFFEPDREMVFYRNLDDLETKIRFFLENPEEREEIIRLGRDRVLREHVYAKRVPTILERLKTRVFERYGGIESAIRGVSP